MKRIALFFLILFFPLFIYAEELHRPHRYFEFGLDAGFGVSNNTAKISDIFVKEIRIDLKDWLDYMGAAGFNMGLTLNSKAFVNINLDESVRLGFYLGTENSGFFEIEQELFEYLEIGEIKNATFDARMYYDSFFAMGGSFSAKVKKGRLTVGLNGFIPLMHGELKNVSSGVEVDDNTGIKAYARGNVNLYSCTNPDDVINGNIEISELSRGLGMDLSLAYEFPLSSKFQLGFSGRIPVVPGRLFYRNTYAVNVTANVSTFPQILNNGDIGASEMSSESYSAEAAVMIHRPLKFGAELAWRPHGAYFTFHPMLGFGIRYPFTSDFYFYPEYKLAAEFELVHTAGVTFSTAYLEQTFIHQLDFLLNLRVLELDVGFSLQSRDFWNSFAARGIGGFAGVRLGW